MAGASLLTLLDDIATLLDDVALLTKVAAKKTAGVLGDDLALNAQQVTGVRAERELPVVWAVFKGSALNKLIMVPIALALSAFMPWIITPLLMLGGAFLCYEGFEKVAHRLLISASEDEEEHKQRLQAVVDKKVDMVAFEKKRIRGAIRTDAILSAEIIVIVLGTVQETDLVTPHPRAIGGRRVDHDWRIRLSRRHRQTRRHRHVPYRQARRLTMDPLPALVRRMDSALGAEVHEDAVSSRHCGNVPGRRWHPGSRHSVHGRGAALCRGACPRPLHGWQPRRHSCDSRV